jgi:hypothetical protein
MISIFFFHYGNFNLLKFFKTTLNIKPKKEGPKIKPKKPIKGGTKKKQKRQKRKGKTRRV